MGVNDIYNLKSLLTNCDAKLRLLLVSLFVSSIFEQKADDKSSSAVWTVERIEKIKCKSAKVPVDVVLSWLTSRRSSSALHAKVLYSKNGKLYSLLPDPLALLLWSSCTACLLRQIVPHQSQTTRRGSCSVGLCSLSHK